MKIRKVQLESVSLAAFIIIGVTFWAWYDAEAGPKKGYDTEEVGELYIDTAKMEKGISYYEMGVMEGSEMTIDRFIQVCYTDELSVLKLERDGRIHHIYCNSADTM